PARVIEKDNRGRKPRTADEQPEPHAGEATDTKPKWGRIRRNFDTEAEARGEEEKLRAKIANEQILPRLQTRLTESQLQEAESCFERVSKSKVTGASLSMAVDFFLSNYREPVEPSTL